MVSPQTASENEDSVPPPPPPVYDEEMEKRLRQFEPLTENQYLTERLSCKEAKKMVCDCFLTEEEIESDEYGCGDDCLNRLLMIECGPDCVVKDRCTNKRFQRQQYTPCEVFRTEKKGFGIRATKDIGYNEFIMEYVGEVLDTEEFDRRASDYSKDKNRHYYFMALRADAVIDATMKGNISRFINHSCDPNAETQKWTVNGELRIGFFSKRNILAGDEITFDYQFQRYGKEAQKCFCEAPTCRGWIGEEPDSDEDSESDDEDDDDDDEESTEEVEQTAVKQEAAEETDKPVVVKPKKERKPPKKRTIKKQRMDIFEDMDLDDEIANLTATGVKNQAHTLKLSRLLVRAKDVSHRMKLLKLLKEGALPCRRLFLDYHGLRLIHGWMVDTAHKNNLLFKILILETLRSLPILNKTLLQDSKVLSTVEKWSTGAPDSEQNSPSDTSTTVEIKKEDAPPAVPVDEPPPPNTIIDIDKENERLIKLENERHIVNLTTNLLNDWAVLKEVFRIPKKERIEQMKEHEREADKGYKAPEVESKRYTDRYRRDRRDRDKDRDRDRERDRDRDRDDRDRKLKSKLSSTISDRGLSRPKEPRLSDRHIVPIPMLSKHERRHLFALQVAKDEEERRKKQQQEVWRHHEQRCFTMGLDPRKTTLEDSSSLPLIWNSQTGQWQLQTFPNISPNPLAPALPPIPIGHPSALSMQNLAFDSNLIHQRPLLQNSSVLIQQPPPLKPDTTQYTTVEINGEKVTFAGPLPPPVVLPPKWKCAHDKYGRPYYYHIKLRIPQWEPPAFTPAAAPSAEDADLVDEDDSTSSSDTSSLSSDSTTDSEDDSELGDTKLLLEIRQKLKNTEENEINSPVIKAPETESPLTEMQAEIRKPKKKREGLVEEILISPLTEEEITANKIEHRKFKDLKEKRRRQKEILAGKKRARSKQTGSPVRLPKRYKTNKISDQMEALDLNTDEGRKMKEIFRKNVADVIVQHLNSYRKPDCKIGRITNTDDFKHLARKLTHFVMSKEIKCGVLAVNESVKTKSKDLIRKYMLKFGEVYSRPKDDDL